ncbi:MAG: hypothetical protein VKJ04_01095 [Vampirovibrionales bacterium]|nr:hypothetical protein [Vampirovibrionales bacterium]
MSSIPGTLAHYLPITSKLNPLQKKNWGYLLVSAAATRMGIAGIRVFENHPNRLQDTDMTESEKKKSFAERVFMEIFGTTFYLFILHLGQDIFAKIFENWKPDMLSKAKQEGIEEIQESLREIKAGRTGKVNLDPKEYARVFDKHVGNDMRHMVTRVLYGIVDEKGKAIRASRVTMAEELGISAQDMYKKLPRSMSRLAFKLNILGGLAALGGVLVSAAVGGTVVQWFNDNILSQYLNRRYPENRLSGFETLPAQFGNTAANPFEINNRPQQREPAS